MNDRSDSMRAAATLAVALLCGLQATGCTAREATAGAAVWAVNVGGPAYVATDGIAYAADASVSGGATGRIDAPIKGSQDPRLYQTFRAGDVRISHALPDGTYDVTFQFGSAFRTSTAAVSSRVSWQRPSKEDTRRTG